MVQSQCQDIYMYIYIYTTQYDRKKFAERGTLLQNIATKGVYLP
jgi:hypothetical protein